MDLVAFCEIVTLCEMLLTNSAIFLVFGLDWIVAPLTLFSFSTTCVHGLDSLCCLYYAFRVTPVFNFALTSAERSQAESDEGGDGFPSQGHLVTSTTNGLQTKK